MSALHDWHREVFTKRTDVTLVFPARTTTFGGFFPEQRSDVNIGLARSVVCQRAVHGMTPAEKDHALKAFDASPEGQALESEDPSVRREHCDLWLLRKLFEAEHPDMPPESELAKVEVLEHHAKTEKVAAHRARLVAHLRDGKPLGHEQAVS